MSLARFLIVFILVLPLGCASSQEDTARQPFAPGVTLTLPDVPPFGEMGETVQLVQASYGGRQQNFQSMIKGSAEHFSLTMSVPSGPRIMSVDWRRGSIATKKESIAPADLSSERVLMDLMMVYAPEDALRRAIEGGDLVVDGTSRKIEKNGSALVIVVRTKNGKWDDEATLTNFAYNYTIGIKSRRVEQ